MLRGENIVCLAKDWSEVPTCNNHVMRVLARDNRVLWLNSIAARSPKLSSKRDLGKIGAKVVGALGGLRQVEHNLWVYTPIVLPYPQSAAAVWINRHILRAMIRALRLKLGMGRFQLWTFMPTSGGYVGSLGESLSVYYCTDEHSQISYMDADFIREQEKELIRKVDIVFATAQSLKERKRVYNPETHLSSHGVDFEHFHRAMAQETAIPDDVAHLPRPIVGFFGVIHDWVDQELMGHIAQRHPDWSVVVLGQANVDVSGLSRLPNVHLLGRKSYGELPGYCKAFSVGLIPFRVNELTVHVNPIKLREYLSAGLPVVSTHLPEVELYREHCAIADSREEFLAACERAIAGDSPDARAARCRAMEQETWEKKVAALGDRVLEVQAKKGLAAAAR